MMPLSRLRQHESEGQRVAQTLARFWQDQYGQPFEVRWEPARPGGEQQTWWYNNRLHALFTPGAEAALFEPLRQEFGGGSRWRERYAALALSRAGAPWLAQAGLRVTPAVPHATRQVIVAGRRKLRLLDYQHRAVYTLLKQGSDPLFMQQELSARRLAARLDLPVPPVLAVAPDGGSWYREAYLEGLPLPRLADPVAGQAKTQAVLALTRLLTATTLAEPAAAYLERLETELYPALADNPLLSPGQTQTLRRQVERLSGRCRSLLPEVGRTLLTALSHGDFQPANIWVNKEGVWLLEWADAARRQVGYDALVFTLAARRPPGLAARLRRFINHGLAEPGGGPPARWPIADWPHPSQRAFYAALFLLEELHRHLAGYTAGPGLVALSREVDLFL